MSYMRYNHPLRWFKGNSESYVFPTSSNGSIEDYRDGYENNCSFVELIGRITLHETNDATYADKIVRILAKKLNIYHNLRVDIPLTSGQIRGIESIIDTELYIPEKAVLKDISTKFNAVVIERDREDIAEYMRFYPEIVDNILTSMEIIRDKFPESLTQVRIMPHDRDSVILDIVMPDYGDRQEFLKHLEETSCFYIYDRYCRRCATASPH
jgi:hypothetical protein